MGSMRSRGVPRAPFAAVIAALTLAACGPGETGAPPPGTIVVPTPTPTPAPSPSPSPSPAANTTLSFGSLPAAAAGTPFASPQTLPLAIGGTFPSSIAVTDTDPSGATGLVLNGAPPAASVTVTKPSDTVALSYSGLAIPPVTISAKAADGASASAIFAPSLAPIVYAGPQRSGAPEVDLYATSGAGSSATFTLAESGWTGAPYARNFALTVPAACANIANVTPASGTAFGVTIAAAPVNGSCTISLADGVHAAPLTVTLTASISTLGVQ